MIIETPPGGNLGSIATLVELLYLFPLPLPLVIVLAAADPVRAAEPPVGFEPDCVEAAAESF